MPGFGLAAGTPVVHCRVPCIPSPVYRTESEGFGGAGLHLVTAADIVSDQHPSHAGVHQPYACLWKVALLHEAFHPGHASC